MVAAATALHASADAMDLYFSRQVSDNEEALFNVRMPLTGSWNTWRPLEGPQMILKPTTSLDIGKSGRRDLRDPFILRGDGRLYLYHAAGEERYLCLATAEAPGSGL